MDRHNQDNTIGELNTLGLSGLCAIWRATTIRAWVRNAAHLAAEPETTQRLEAQLEAI